MLAAGMLLAGCASPAEKTEEHEPQGKAYFTYFDTVSYVYSFAGDSAESFDRLSAEASAVLGEYHRLFDIYHEYSGMNNLCTVNKNAGGEAISVDKKLIDFLLYAEEMCSLTDGEFNMMLGPVLLLWHECREAAGEDPDKASIPTDEELERAAEHTSPGLLEIDEQACTVRITDPEASIDAGALGKGYATEMAAQALMAQGAQGYVLNIGGNIRTIGTKPDGSDWTTAVRDPLDSDSSIAARLHISDTSCVTSGIYERYFVCDGVSYHHIIDKDTLFPSVYYASLTVVTESSALADALSTALFCMDYEQGRALAESLDGVEVLWIFNDGSMKYTSGIAGIIEE